MGDSEKGWCCCDIPWGSSSCQDALRYFIALLFSFKMAFWQFSEKALNSDCLQELPTVSCSSGSCLKYLLLSSVMQCSKCILYQSSECGGSQWCHSSSTVLSMKGSDLWLPHLYQAQQQVGVCCESVFSRLNTADIKSIWVNTWAASTWWLYC